MSKNNITEINNGVKRMNQQDLYTQQVIKGLEAFIPESDNNKQTNISKMSKIGRKLPGIKKNEYFKFNSKEDFSIQRGTLTRFGASEVGSIFLGVDAASELIISRVLKSFRKEVPYKDNLHIKKGKALENLGFDEFLRIYFDNIQVLHKNKYANGIDKYNYFKRVGLGDNLVGATIDGWFVNNQGEAELLEIKCDDNNYLTSAITEYNQTGNFLDSKYFFKYYVQAQVQLACTGLSKCNLFFLISDEPINCVIERNNGVIGIVMIYIAALDMEVGRICNIIKNDNSIDLANIDIEDLTNHIKLFLQDSQYYSSLTELNYKDEFINFINIVNLNIGSEERELLEKHLVDIQSKQTEIEKKEKENAKELYALTKQDKDVLKDIFGKLSMEFSLTDNIVYRLGKNIFALNAGKRAIKDRFKLITDHYDYYDINDISSRRKSSISNPLSFTSYAI
ncbi:DUF244 domain-containing protein [Borrelia duttonii]|uniref:BppA n=1 Tax=Borrelia duttonii (strain Ly) TaxID=412419 RepID=B5RPC1_BORDL|nr:BppA [Borrelia duttonii Ly]